MAMNPDDAPATQGEVKSLKRGVDLLQGDVKQLQGDSTVLAGDVAALKDELKAFTRKFALEIIKTNARTDQQVDALRGALRVIDSKLSAQIDGVMSSVGKTDRAQTIADWRMTQLEGRVDKIESRPS